LCSDSDNNMTLADLKRQCQDDLLKKSNFLTTRFVNQVLKEYDGIFLEYTDDKYTCILCNSRCSRIKKTRHEKTTKHVKNMEDLKNFLEKKLNGYVDDESDDD